MPYRRAKKNVCAEMIVTSLNEEGKTLFAAVRLGMFLAVEVKSVVPLFKEQISERWSTYRHRFPNDTVFHETIPEASRLVIQAGALMHGGEIVLDMGISVKILDLAKNDYLERHTEEEIKRVAGIRSREKLYMELPHRRAS